MIYLKKFNYYLKENIDIDPFEEEDWDEVDTEEIPFLIKKLKNKEIDIFNIPLNILKHLNDLSFDLLRLNNKDTIVEDSIKLFNLISNNNNVELLFSKILENLNTKDDFYLLLKYKNTFNNFEELLSNSINILFENIKDIDMEFIEYISKFINISELLNSRNFISNITGESLYNIMKNYDLDLDEIEVDSLEYESIIYLIGKFYIENKIEKNSLTSYFAYLISKNEDFFNYVKIYKNKNNEKYILYNDLSNLEDFFNNRIYKVNMVDYWDYFLDNNYNPPLEDFTYYLNINATLFFVKLFKKYNIGDFSNFNLENLENNEKEFQKLKNYLEEIVFDGKNNKFDSDLDFDEIIDEIKKSLNHAQSDADANEYFNILTRQLKKYFYDWENSNTIYNWNESDKLAMKPKLDFLFDKLYIPSLIYNYGYYFDIYDMIDNILNDDGRIIPNIDYVDGDIDKNYFSELIVDNLYNYI